MARLAAFKVDHKAIEDGEWISPGEQYDDIEIRTRGLTDSYFDAQATKLRRAAMAYGGDTSKIPQAKRREINVECLLAHVTQDVRNLIGPDGQPVMFEAFKGLLRDPAYGELVVMCFHAAALVGRVKAAETTDAAGN